MWRWHFDSQSAGQGHLVVLFLNQNVTDMLGDGIFAELFTLLHALSIVMDRLGLGFQVETQHVFRFG